MARFHTRLPQILSQIQVARISVARWIDAFWGYDVFIAHRRADAAQYANEIFNTLTAERVTAFIDREVYGPGDSLLVATRRHVTKSTVFLLLGSPEILAVRKPVDWVEREIDTYLTSHAVDPTLILIDFGGTIATTLASHDAHTLNANPILGQLAPFLHIREELPALLQPPSEQVLDAIRRNLKGRRRDRSRLRFFEGIAAVLALFLLAAVALGVVAWQQKNVAIEETARARANEYATKARTLISSSPRAAALAAIEATRQTTTGAPEPVSQETLSAAVSQMRGIPLAGHGRFRDDLSWPESIALSEDGRHAAVGDWDGSVFLWNIADRTKPVCTSILPPLYEPWNKYYGISPAPVTNVGLSQDGRWIAIATRTQGDMKFLRVININDIEGRTAPKLIHSGVYSEVNATAVGSRLLLLKKGRLDIELLDLDKQSRDLTPTVTHRSDRPILATTTTPDGRLIASIDAFGQIIILSADDASIVKSITLPALASLPSAWDDEAAFKKSFEVSSLRLSSDGKYVALLSSLPSERSQPQQMAELWDISQDTAVVVATYPSAKNEFGIFDEGNGNLVTEIAFSPDSSRMALAHNHELRLWDLSRTTPAAPPNKVITLSAEYSTLAYSPDSKWLSIGNSDGGVRTVALDSLEDDTIIVLNAEDGAGEINSLTFSKGSDLLLAAGHSDAAWLLNPNGGTASSGFLQLAPPPLQEGETVHVSDDGSVAAALSKSGLWFASLSDLKTRLMPLPSAIGAGTKQHLYFYADGRRAVVWDEESPRLYVINLDSGIAHATVTSIDYPGPVLANFTFDPRGRWVVANDKLRRAVLLPLRDLGPSLGPAVLNDYEGGGFIFSAQSNWVLSGIAGRMTDGPYKPHLWKLDPARIDHYALPGAQLDNLENHRFSPDGRWLASSEGYKPVQGENKVYIWPLDTDAGPRDPVRISTHIMKSDTLFSPDAQWMVSFDALPGAMDDRSGKHLRKKLCLWKIPQFETPVWERSFEVQSVEVSFSPDSSWLTVGTDGTVSATLLDLRSPSLPETPGLNSGGVLLGDWKFTFSRDGRWFSTQGINAAVRLWQLNDAKHPSLVEQNLVAGSGYVAFSLNSRTLAASNKDITRVFWLSATGKPLRRISLPAGGEPHYSQSDSRLVLRSSETLKIIELDTDNIIANVAIAVGRNLTWREWNGLFPDRPYAKTFPELPADPSIAREFLERAETALSSGNRKQAADDYRAASDWAIDAGHPVAANEIAWSGVTHGFAEVVLPAAEFAVRQAPTNGNYRDTRGVARCALADMRGALDDFEAYLTWARSLSAPESSLTQRREWIGAMRAGTLPNGLCDSEAN